MISFYFQQIWYWNLKTYISYLSTLELLIFSSFQIFSFRTFFTTNSHSLPIKTYCLAVTQLRIFKLSKSHFFQKSDFFFKNLWIPYKYWAVIALFGRSDYNKQNSQIAVTFTDDGQTALLHDPLVLDKQGNFELYNRSVLFPNEFCSDRWITCLQYFAKKKMILYQIIEYYFSHEAHLKYSQKIVIYQI